MSKLYQKYRSLKKGECGAVEMVEAAIIYPFVFLAIGIILYLGIYMVQYATVKSYAEKIALFGAREIASPGYLDMITSGSRASVFGTAAVEVDMDVTENEEENVVVVNSGTMKINYDPGEVDARPYRYWAFFSENGPFTEASKTMLENLLNNLVASNSILCSNDVVAKLTPENYFLVQYVNVSVSQELQGMELLNFFGIDSPKVEVNTKCPVNDVDEFVRTTDFAVDGLEMLAKRLGIDIDQVKEKVEQAKETLGLN